MDHQTTSRYAQHALAKREVGAALNQNEERRLARLDSYARGYRPLGTAPAQLADRIHTLQDPSGANQMTYTLPVCISGVVYNVDFVVTRGPH